jgi:adenylate cyclase
MSIEEMLLALGATPAEIEQARRASVLGLLAMTYAALPGQPRYTAAELAAEVGMERTVSRRLWRALGFPDVDESERVFTEADAQALSAVNAMLTAGLTDVDLIVQMTRVMGSSMARIADAMVSAAPAMRAAGGADAHLVFESAEAVFATQSHLLDYIWRRHLHAILRQRLVLRLDTDAGAGARVPSPAVAVGFADLVGFTAMSQQLESDELAKVVARFEELAFDQITARGGRVAKMIGDEVMFVVHDADAAVETALALAEAYADDEVLSDVRVGVAFGDVLAYEGDYFGPVVNLASRIVNIAFPGSVVVSESVHDALADDPRFTFHSLRPRHLKDIGRVPLWRVRHT